MFNFSFNIHLIFTAKDTFDQRFDVFLLPPKLLCFVTFILFGDIFTFLIFLFLSLLLFLINKLINFVRQRILIHLVAPLYHHLKHQIKFDTLARNLLSQKLNGITHINHFIFNHFVHLDYFFVVFIHEISQFNLFFSKLSFVDQKLFILYIHFINDRSFNLMLFLIIDVYLNSINYFSMELYFF